MPRLDGPDHIFVYGTLMTTASGALGRDMRDRLARAATSLGAATMPGRLFDLGDYPGASAADGPADIVHGEVLLLRDRDATLGWLDDYEGIGRGAQAIGEYERVIEVATLADGRTVEAWFYRFLRPTAGLPQLRDGRWRGPTKQE